MHALVRQTGRIGKMRARQPEFGSALVHDAGKGVLGAANPFGKRDAGVVAGLDDHRFQQVLDPDLGVELGEHGRPTRGGAAVAPGMFGDEELVIHRQAAVLQLGKDDLDRHQLGHGRRLHRRVGLLLKQDRPGLVIHEHRIGRLGVEIELSQCRQGRQHKSDGRQHQAPRV